MSSDNTPIRVVAYGYGPFAERTRIPNFLRTPGVRLTAIADLKPERRQLAARVEGNPRIYNDALDMVEAEDFEILCSIVPPGVRGPVEERAVAKGAHVFMEKPQAESITQAVRLSELFAAHGTITEVGTRETYRPLIQKARDFLAGKRIAHVRYERYNAISYGRQPDGTVARHPGWFFGWGSHALKYINFMTGLSFVQAQAFVHYAPSCGEPMASSINLRLSNGGTCHLAMTQSMPAPYNDQDKLGFEYALPWFTFFYEGGYLAVAGVRRLVSNGEIVYEEESRDPWQLQIGSFVQAVRTGDPSLCLSSFESGMNPLAALMAAWDSANRCGVTIDVNTFLRDAGHQGTVVR